MQVSATLRHLQASAQKVRLVADLIRGKDVQEAVNILGLTKKSSAKDLQKLLKSAIANAENRDDKIDVDKLYVKEIFVDGGPSLKRIQPATMGRAFRIMKRQSHITIRLETRRAASSSKPSTEAPAAKTTSKSKSKTKAPARKSAAKQA
jgi:large subunit ribosomal protein L22